jgi:menaquinone-9 beta-reductase
MTDPDYDVIVVGARCAGAATAMLLARAGLSVLAVDKGSYQSDTRSTLALMRTGVAHLARWGLLERLRGTGVPSIRSTTFHYGDEDVVVTIKPRDGVDALHAPRRNVLDALLVDAAREAGAEIVHRTRLRRLIRTGEAVTGAVIEGASGARSITARLVVGADGVGSAVARQVEAPTIRRGRHASAIVYAFTRELELEGYHWYNAPGISAGAIPTHDGEHCVFAALPPPRFRAEVSMGLEVMLARALAEVAPALSSVGYAGHRAFSGRTGHLRQASGPGWALVGDAGYFKDPLTAHGMTDAFRDAELLSRRILGGDLHRYPGDRDEASLPLFAVTDAIASFAWDLPRLKELHRELHEAMAHEHTVIERLRARTPEVPVATAATANATQPPQPPFGTASLARWPGQEIRP